MEHGWTLILNSADSRSYHLYLTFSESKTDSGKCYVRSSCQLSGSLCFKLSWEYPNSRLQNGSQYTLSFAPARSPSTCPRASGTDSFIFIVSPGKFSLQPQFMTCKPGASHILLWHISILSQIISQDRHLDMPNLPCWKKVYLPTFPFLGEFSLRRNSHNLIHDFIHMMGGNLLLFHLSPLPRLTHRQCC